jgi:hypothetical protein
MHLLWRRDVMVRAQSEDVRDAVRGRGLCSGAGACAVRWATQRKISMMKRAVEVSRRVCLVR